MSGLYIMVSHYYNYSDYTGVDG